MSNKIVFDKISFLSLLYLVIKFKKKKIYYFSYSTIININLIRIILKIKRINIEKINYDISDLNYDKKSYYWHYIDYEYKIGKDLLKLFLKKEIFNFKNHNFLNKKALELYLLKRNQLIAAPFMLEIAKLKAIYNLDRVSYYSNSINLYEEIDLTKKFDIKIIFIHQFINGYKVLFRHVIGYIIKYIKTIFLFPKKIHNFNKNIISMPHEDAPKVDYDLRGQPVWNFQKVKKVQYIILSSDKKLLNNKTNTKFKYISYFNPYSYFNPIFTKKDILITQISKLEIKYFFNFLLNIKKINKSLNYIFLTSILFDSKIHAHFFSVSNCNKYAYLDAYNKYTDSVNIIRTAMNIKSVHIQYSFMKKNIMNMMKSSPNTFVLFSDIFKKQLQYKSINKTNITYNYIYTNYYFLTDLKSLNYRLLKFKNANKLNKGVFKIGYFDESANNNHFGLISSSYYRKELVKIINYIEKHSNTVLVTKTQFSRNNLSHIFKDDITIIKLIKSKKIIELSQLSSATNSTQHNERNMYFPSALSSICDVSIGHFFGGSASMEAGINKDRSIMINSFPDPLNNKFLNLINNSNPHIIFSNISTALEAINKYRKKDTLYNNLGDWSGLINIIQQSKNSNIFDLEDKIINL